MNKVEQKFLIALKAKMLADYPGGFWFKIPDAPTAKQIAKPFDAFFATKGKTYAIEAKSIEGLAPLKMSHLRQSQIDGLTRAQENGWTSLVVAYYPECKGFLMVDFKTLIILESIKPEKLIPIKI